jgi:hypothetical protein
MELDIRDKHTSLLHFSKWFYGTAPIKDIITIFIMTLQVKAALASSPVIHITATRKVLYE